MIRKKVWIAGAGIISALGNSLSETFHALVQQQTGIRPLANFGVHFPETPLAGEVRLSNAELVHFLDLTPSKPYSRTFLLGLYAARQATEAAGFSHTEYQQACFISATSVGGMDQTEHFMKAYNKNPASGRISVIGQHDCGASSETIARKLGIHGFTTTINTACSSSANAIMLGARMIQAGQTDLVIAGGTDALCAFTLHGFKSLMLLSDTYNKPFDQSRNGLNLGEGAAYLVLCSEKILGNRKPLAVLSGWGNANDAYHQTASSPEGRGAQLAMQKALTKANIEAASVDYINAHGTATPNNDLAESMALKTLFTTVPPFSSTKPFTGHTLAAAGSIEAVISCLALQHQTTFSNLNFTAPMEETGFIPEIHPSQRSLEYILSNSFGFGGNCSALVFKNSLA